MRALLEPARFVEQSQIEHELADCHTHPRGFPGAAENTIGKILDRKMRIGRDGDEGPQRRIVGWVHQISPSALRPSRGSSKLQLPKEVTTSRRADSIVAVVASSFLHRRPGSSKWKLAASLSSKIAWNSLALKLWAWESTPSVKILRKPWTEVCSVIS